MKSTRLSLKQILAFGPIIGREGEDDPKDAGGAGDDGKKDTKDKGGDGGADDPKDKGDDKGGDPQKKIAALEEEKDRHHAARTEAERERDELRQKVEEAERKEKSDLENAKSDLEKRDKTIAELTATNESLALENAFLKSNKHEWQNPTRALASADLSGVMDKGKVDDEKLKAALDKLAKDEPYLVKPKEDPKKPPVITRTGQPVNKQTATDAADREALKKKYSSLRQR